MKTKKLSFAMLLVVAVAMSAFGQTSKREVVFTMNANEVIYQNEYALFQTFNRNRFACITLDTITDKYTFVFNGERIKTASSCGNQWDDEWHLYYINPGEAKGYIFAYRENGRWYINYRGVVDGGFDDVTLFSSDYEGERYTPEKNYDYLYKLAGRWYVSKNGKNRKISLIERTGEYGKYYVNVNGSTVGGPYGSFVDYLTLTESGKYAYCYWDNGYYVNVNGSTVAGPYESIYGLTLTENGKYTYLYEDNDKYYVNVNGSTVAGPYENYIYGLTLTEEGKYSYRFYKNRKHYINTNGVVAEERENQFLDNDYYWNDVLDLTSKDDGHSFYSSHEYDYVVIDGRPYGQSPAIEGWYDESKNAFIWNAVENRELVVYEYTLE